MRVNLGRHALLHDATLVHHDDAVAEAHGLFLIMRDDNGGGANRTENFFQLEPQLLPELGIEGRQRLVEQDHFR